MVHRLSQSFWVREDTFQELWIHMKAIPAPLPPVFFFPSSLVQKFGTISHHSSLRGLKSEVLYMVVGTETP